MILLTGGSGRLGHELQKLLECHAPASEEFDILSPKWSFDPSLVVHCAAYTDVLGAELHRDKAADVNVTGTRNVARFPLVYISTEYVFDGKHGNYSETDHASPVNWYAKTKLAGEFMAQKAPRSLVIRCLFKPRPFPHPRACVDQFTTGDYVDVIAPMIAECVRRFGEFDKHDTIHVGTERKSTHDLACRTRDVSPISIDDVPVKLPADTSLNLAKWRAFHGH